jgi:hypothetical protein
MKMSNAGDASGVPLPPAITREPVVSEMSRSASSMPLPPFLPGATPRAEMAPEPAPGRAAEPAPLELTEAMESAAVEPVDWPDMRGDDEGDAMRPWDDGTGDDAVEDAVRAATEAARVAAEGQHVGAEPDRADAEAGGDADAPDGDFPLDAFFVPLDSQRVPTGYDEAEHREVAERVSGQLEELAKSIRTRGMTALGATPASDDLSKLIAAVVAGYYTRAR